MIEGGDALREVLAGGDLHAPTLLDVEVVAAVRGLVLGGRLSAARGRDVLTDFDDLPIQRWASAAEMRERMFGLRDTLTPYDAAYVALAEALGCPLLTRDARLARSSGHDVEVLVR